MFRFNKSEKGQAIVVVAIVIVVLLGLTALAIDGGMIYTDRRDAQNAVDSAALAGALEKANLKPNLKIVYAIENSLNSNGYDAENSSSTISGELTDLFGKYYLVTVTLTDTTQTYFAQMFTGSELTTRVMAEVKIRTSQPYMPGVAIIAMGNCVDDGGSLLSSTGGGNSGGVITFDGGMFVNTPETAGNACAIDPPNNGVGITANDGYLIYSVGDYNYSGEDDISPLPVVTSVNGGMPIGDPLANLSEPQCTGPGHVSGSTFYPGRYGGSGEPDLDWGTYLPGIYCITGDLDPNGNGTIDARSGVVFYFIDGRINMTGQGNLLLTAPDGVTCTTGGRTDPCSYNHIGVFAARGNTNEFRLTGNGTYSIEGLVYTLDAYFEAKGGGHLDDEYVIEGQLICNNVSGRGNGSFDVQYVASNTYWMPAQISLVK